MGKRCWLSETKMITKRNISPIGSVSKNWFFTSLTNFRLKITIPVNVPHRHFHVYTIYRDWSFFNTRDHLRVVFGVTGPSWAHGSLLTYDSEGHISAGQIKSASSPHTPPFDTSPSAKWETHQNEMGNKILSFWEEEKYFAYSYTDI